MSAAPPSAASAPIRLKIRTPVGDKLLSGDAGLTRASTLLQLQQRLQELVGIPVAEQRLSATYPPPGHVFEGPEWATLAELQIQPNDTLTLKRIEAQAPAPPQVEQPQPAVRASSPNARPPATLAELAHLRPLAVQHIANDNSCLFNSVGGLLEGFAACGPPLVTELRQTVASIILADTSDKFNEAALGDMAKEKYAEHIMKPDTWGGGIELAVLSDFYDLEIAALDVETCHQYLFGVSDDESHRKTRRIYLVYTGVHYDALEDRDVDGAPRRIFDPNDQTAEARALLAARQLQASGAFTNVSNFTLRCSICQAGMIGAADAQEHAKATGHANFEEYKR